MSFTKIVRKFNDRDLGMIKTSMHRVRLQSERHHLHIDPLFPSLFLYCLVGSSQRQSVYETLPLPYLHAFIPIDWY